MSTAQLLLLLDGLPANTNGDLAEADAKLRASSRIDEKPGEDEAAKTLRRRAVARRALPEQLRRVENLIVVPNADRPCPSCGAERKCIGHDVTEVLDLVPAEVIVRLDKRKKLACV